MAIQINELDVWEDNMIPIIIVNADGDFDIWYSNTPVEERDARVTETSRRRAVEF
jgi:hypothetical protein